jgi:serine/threonine-protein kinase RsbW
MNFSILSDPSNLKIVRDHLKSFIKEKGFQKVDQDSVILATDEAVQNVMRYAYNLEKDKKIDVTFEVKDPNLIIQIRDYGKQVPIEQIKPRELDDVKPGGLGVHFIRNICEKVVALNCRLKNCDFFFSNIKGYSGFEFIKFTFSLYKAWSFFFNFKFNFSFFAILFV